ncbi:MAG TPA: FtsW/RodA/SpoVE family cell cycle protein [Candidatus Microsaccharimonas sp.]
MRDRGWNSKPSSDVVRRHRPDYMIMLFMGLLMLIGLVTLYAIGPQRANVLNSSYGSSYGSTYFFVKQIISLAIALVGFFAFSTIPYEWVLKQGKKLLWISLGLCAVLFIAGAAHLAIAPATLGAVRWFQLGSIGSIQPAEMLKFGILVFLGGFIGTRAKQGLVNDTYKTLIPVAAVAAISLLFVVVLQKDLGTGVAIIGIIAAMMMIAGVNKRIGLIAVVTLAVLGVILILIAPHRIQRIVTYVGGSDAEGGSSYQIDNALIAIGTGGIKGVGIGNSVQASGYLPEATNDSVFAIMGEVFGFIGLMVILLILFSLLMRLLSIMDHLVDIRLKLLVAGVFGWFGTHVILNIAAIIGVFPLTGITLPLLSFGGTSLIFLTAALGLVFQLSRYTVHSSRVSTIGDKKNEDSRSGRRVGRTRYASRRSS